MKRAILGAAACVLGLVVAFAVFAGRASAGTVDPDGEGRKFAYGENVQWFNFEPTIRGGVTVTDTAVTGWVWSRTAGWINLGPVVYDGGVQGVTRDGDGNLSGWAWGKNIGWISFSCENTGSCGTVDYGVRIDLSDGVFEGTAWSRSIGWIYFDLGAFSDYAVKTALNHSVSGNAGVGVAVLSYEDGGAKTAVAEGSGAYSFAVSYGWSGTVTPSKDGYSFDPASRSYSGVQADLAGQDYAAVPGIGPAPIPSLNEWGAAILVMAILLASVGAIRRRRA